MNKKNTLNLFALALIFYFSLSAMETDENITGEDISQFMAAARTGEVNTVANYLDKGVHINTQDPNEFTALIYAAMFGETEVIVQLLAYEPDVNIRDVRGCTALIQAARSGYTPIVVQLLTKGVGTDLDIQDNSGHTAYYQTTNEIKALMDKYRAEQDLSNLSSSDMDTENLNGRPKRKNNQKDGNQKRFPRKKQK